MTEIGLGASIFVAGHKGLVGSAIVRKLEEMGHKNILTADRTELDLVDQRAVSEWFEVNRPDYVYLVAGTVGGIQANSTRPAEFLFENLAIATNVIESSRRSEVAKLLYLGSSCIYPRNASQPISEDALLGGYLEPTNEGYALAKISGLKMCEYYRQQYGCNFITAMPTNLYGPNDNFDLEGSHVLPALMRKFHEARECGSDEVTVWGTGRAQREFLHVDDLASACAFLMSNFNEPGHINVGTGVDITIRELAETIGRVVYPAATLIFDTTKPDGTPRKVLDVSRLSSLGWTASTDLQSGISRTYEWFLENENSLRGMSAEIGEG